MPRIPDPPLAPVEKPALVYRLVAILGSSRKLSTVLGVPSDHSVRWRRMGFIPARWADHVGELDLSDEWGHITALDVLKADREGRAARKRREVVEQAARLAELEAALAEAARAGVGPAEPEQ